MANIIITHNEEDAFSNLFLNVLKHGLPAIIIVPDMYWCHGLERFIKRRTSIVHIGMLDGHLSQIHILTPHMLSSLHEQVPTSILYTEGTNMVAATAMCRASGIDPYIVSINHKESSSTFDYWDDKSTSRIIPDYPKQKCMLENKAIRDQFINTFSIATEEIDIICPWINRWVVNDTLLSLIDEALHRGVRIKIRYGIGDDTDPRSQTSSKTVEYLRDYFSCYGDSIRFHKEQTHIKLLLCDDKYMMIGSYNFLSFAGDYESKSERNEAVEFIVDRTTIAQRRQRFFDW